MVRKINSVNINQKMKTPSNLLSIFYTSIRVSALPLIAILLFIQTGCSQDSRSQNLMKLTTTIPVDGNCWVGNHPEKNRSMISEASIRNWSSEEDTIHLYFHTPKKGEFHLGMIGRNKDGISKIKINFEGRDRILELQTENRDTLYIGKFKVTTPGYQRIQLTGVEKSSDYFGEISEFLIGGDSVVNSISFVRDDFYWGKRGPSVHLSYQVPEEAGDILWFYNEIMVPEGNDVLGSYFMANGFAQGYFGMQVNSPTERRILFSVWSPFHTDDPNEIPDDKKIIMLNKGADVYTGEFGNEGSGGQSYLKFPWKAGEKYGFLLKGEPVGDNKTVFTAWLFVAEAKEWKMIASFLRPDTDSYIKRPHSFLENFHTGTGAIARKGVYTNQWVCNTDGIWYEMTRAKFTADATARKNARLDYFGGAAGDAFFMKNCGFSNDHTSIDSFFDRQASNNKPAINLSALPGI